MKRVLITGGTGMIGRHLTTALKKLGYTIHIVTRGKRENEDSVHYFHWDIDQNTIDAGAFEGVDYVLHLAGAGVGDKNWTRTRKKEILNSRVQSTDLLRDYINKNKISLKAFISASAIGIYGNDTGAIELFEDRKRLGDDFLATVVKEWEQRVDEVAAMDIRTVKLRIGVVLSKEGGALSKVALPTRFGLAAPLGSGEQYWSWIHIDDLVGIFIKALEDEKMQGVYNAVAPNPVMNKEFTSILARVMHRPDFLPNVPAFALRLVLGEMASIVLGSSRVSSKKIEAQGYIFKFPELMPALEDLL